MITSPREEEERGTKTERFYDRLREKSVKSMRKSWEYTDRRRWKSPSEHVQFAIFFLIVFLGVFFWHLRPPSTTVGNQRYMTCLDSKKVSQENSSYNWYIFHNFQAYPRNHGVTINSKGISFFRQPECEPCIAKIQSHHH